MADPLLKDTDRIGQLFKNVGLDRKQTRWKGAWIQHFHPFQSCPFGAGGNVHSTVGVPAVQQEDLGMQVRVLDKGSRKGIPNIDLTACRKLDPEKNVIHMRKAAS